MRLPYPILAANVCATYTNIIIHVYTINNKKINHEYMMETAILSYS